MISMVSVSEAFQVNCQTVDRKKVLIIEDDTNIAGIIEYNLNKWACHCIGVTSGEEAFPVLENEEINLIILDVMLPKMNGFDFCRSVKGRSDFKDIPVIMLSARGEEVDRVLGLELGADDYIVKPFSPRELVLRVKAVLKWEKQIQDRFQSISGETISASGLTVDLPRHKVFVENQLIRLTAVEFKLLVFLMQRMGRVQSRERLLRDVWDMGPGITTRTVDTHVSFLRRKLGPAGQLIETVRGYGYRFISDN